MPYLQPKRVSGILDEPNRYVPVLFVHGQQIVCQTEHTSGSNLDLQDCHEIVKLHLIRSLCQIPNIPLQIGINIGAVISLRIHVFVRIELRHRSFEYPAVNFIQVSFSFYRQTLHLETRAIVSSTARFIYAIKILLRLLYRRFTLNYYTKLKYNFIIAKIL